MKAIVNRSGTKTTLKGKSLIDLVEQVMTHGGEGVTIVEIVREEGEEFVPRDAPKK